MPESAPTSSVTHQATRTPGVSFGVLGGISVSHMINDMMQSVLLALYPVIQGNYQLSFVQIGFITVAFQFTASLLQPIVGHFTDKRPIPLSLPLGMASTFCGLILLSQAPNYTLILISAMLIGVGSSVFHPESSRIARMASAGQHGLAQSIFQVGGNFGQSLGPLLAAFLIVPMGQPSVAWVALIALAGIMILYRVSRWYSHNLTTVHGKKSLSAVDNGIDKGRVKLSLGILLVLVFSKFIYLTSITSYLTFYLIDHFGLAIQESQYCLFLFLFGSAIGIIIGGPIGDRIGRKRIILGSILGAAPFALALPYANLTFTLPLIFCVGLIISSAFPSIVVYGQELVPGKTGTISGLFFGLGFGMAGIGAAAIGALADVYSIELVYSVCAFLPLIGIIAFWLPDIRSQKT